MVDDVEGGRSRRGDDGLGRDRQAHRREPRHVVGAVVHRVVRHVDDVVAEGRSRREDRGHARNGIGASIDDTVEVDEQEEHHRPIVAARTAAAGRADPRSRPRTMAPWRRSRPIRSRPPSGSSSTARTCSTRCRRRRCAAPRSALIGRLRGVVPASIAIDVVFDGPSEPGLRGERIASGLRVRYSGGRTADAVLLSLVDETRAVDGPLGTAAILVVTDDRDLRVGPAPQGRPDRRHEVAARPPGPADDESGAARRPCRTRRRSRPARPEAVATRTRRRTRAGNRGAARPSRRAILAAVRRAARAARDERDRDAALVGFVM